MKSLTTIFAAPALCLAVLGSVAMEKRAHTRPEDAAPFHARAKAAIEGWKTEAGWDAGGWPLPESAVQLLRPNVTLTRHYTNTAEQWKQADLLIVQCKDPTDMSGHYPPNCYPNSGQPMVGPGVPRTWTVGTGADTLAINGMEYQFEMGDLIHPSRRCVYNFFVLPGRGIVPDMDKVREATGDYQRRYFGAAQFQVVFPGDLPMEVRDEIFATLIGPNVHVLKVLDPGKI